MNLKHLSRLVEQSQSGQKDALDKLCRLLKSEITGILFKKIHDPQVVEELSQEAYLKLLQGIKNIREPIKINRFVARVVSYVIADYFMEMYKWKEIVVYEHKDHNLEESHFADQSNAVHNKLTIDDIRNNISGSKDKQLINLKLEGKNYDDIARELAISKGAAKMRYKRIIDSLKMKFFRGGN